MKKSKISVVLLGLSLMSFFSACDPDSKKTDPQPTNPQNNPGGKACQIAAVSETTNTGKEDSEFIYDSQGKITRINTKVNGALNEYITFEYNGAGKTTKVSTFDAANNVQDYFTTELNAAGNPVKLNFFSREAGSNQMVNVTRYEYEYNAQNRISKANMFLDVEEEGTLSLAATINYKYDSKGNPSHKDYLVTMETGAEPTLVYTYEYTYDSKDNPAKNIPILNIEPSPVNNLTKVVVTNKMTNAVDKQQSYSMTYEYDNNGYPTKSTTTTQAGVITSLSYSYNCK
jgi:hypothetical protein